MNFEEIRLAVERLNATHRAFQEAAREPFLSMQRQVDEQLAAFNRVGSAAAEIHRLVGKASSLLPSPTTLVGAAKEPKVTRHWVRAFVDTNDEVMFGLVCEHPDDCQETAEGYRSQGCAIKDYFDDMSVELLTDFGETEIGRLEVSCRWRGSGEDSELDLVPPRSS